MLEKDFIYEHVSQLTNRLRGKTQTCKEDTLLLAKKVCLSESFSRPSPSPGPNFRLSFPTLNLLRNTREMKFYEFRNTAKCKHWSPVCSLSESTSQEGSLSFSRTALKF